jgi:hypothetical protein
MFASALGTASDVFFSPVIETNLMCAPSDATKEASAAAMSAVAAAAVIPSAASPAIFPAFPAASALSLAALVRAALSAGVVALSFFCGVPISVFCPGFGLVGAAVDGVEPPGVERLGVLGGVRPVDDGVLLLPPPLRDGVLPPPLRGLFSIRGIITSATVSIISLMGVDESSSMDESIESSFGVISPMF